MACRSCIEKHFTQRSIINYILYPISLLFSIILISRRFLYRNIIPQFRAPVFVISIGNIIVGGSGKTPFTIYLAELLKNRGLNVGVSHRGYKSKLENAVTLISNRNELLPVSDNAGDEAWLIAKRLAGIPVVVGKNRKQAISLICKTFPDLDCVILDDSFQHLKVKHDVDFIIISEWLKFGNGFVLPAGMLREPMSAISDADILILNRIDNEGQVNPDLLNKLKSTGKTMFSGSYNTESVYDFFGKEIKADSIVDDKVLMISGVGNPSGFDLSIKALNLKTIGGIILADHFNYSDTKARKAILDDEKAQAAKWIITTEKDYAKLRNYREFSEKLLVLKIDFKLNTDEEKLTKLILNKMKGSNIPK